MDLHFSDYFGVDRDVLHQYGAFDISVASDLPLFIDPFLIFNSQKAEYQSLHDGVLKYLVYLRDRAAATTDPGVIAGLYRFREVKQNWLGYTVLGNEGRGLGDAFGRALHAALRGPMSGFGVESITASSHLEKLTLIRGGVGKDAISDFTTNLIKDYLCKYTQAFAEANLPSSRRKEFAVERAAFNYGTETWETRRYALPHLKGDFVLLTPYDMLTRHDTWINHSDMLDRFPSVVAAVPDSQLRASINHYFRQHLSRRPTKNDHRSAARTTIDTFPDLIDYYIRAREESGHLAEGVSQKRVAETRQVFVDLLRDLLVALQSTAFYSKPLSSFEEALARAKDFKHYVEQKGGYKLINRQGKKPFSNENEVQILWTRLLRNRV